MRDFVGIDRPDASGSLADRTVLLIIGGGIAAYKSLDLIRRLQERGAHLRCVLTAAAQHFVTPLAVGALTGERAKHFDALFAGASLNQRRANWSKDECFS